MRQIVTNFLLIIVSSTLFAQTNFYVSQSGGNDLNDGLSPQTAWATIQHAANFAIPNSVVHIMEGIYHENVQVNVSGTAGNPIVFTNYQNGHVVIDGTGTPGTSLIRMTNKSWLHFENMELRNLVRDNARGIMAETTPSGYARNLSFKDITIHTIRWTPDDGVIPGSGQDARGFAVVGRGAGIEYISIVDCTIRDNVTGKSEALTFNGNVEDFLIEGCQVFNNTNIGICLAGNYGICANPSVDKTRNGIVRGNICYNNVSPLSSSAGIYVDGGENIVIERNNCFGNGTGISVGCEQNGTTKYITVKNNLIHNNIGRGLAVGGHTLLSTGQVLFSTFRNNTLFQNNSELGYHSEIHLSKASNCVFEDNIIYSNDQNILLSVDNKLPQANNLFNYNCLYTPSGNPGDLNIYWHLQSFASLGQLQQALGQEVNSIFADPQLLSGSGSLSPQSVCLNAGNPALSLPAGELDFYGNPRLAGSAVDIGALEIPVALGLEEFMAEAKPFPNPVTDGVLHFNMDLDDAFFELFDLTGRKLWQSGHIRGRSLKLNTSARGICFYRIVLDGKHRGAGKLVIR